MGAPVGHPTLSVQGVRLLLDVPMEALISPFASHAWQWVLTCLWVFTQMWVLTCPWFFTQMWRLTCFSPILPGQPGGSL